VNYIKQLQSEIAGLRSDLAARDSVVIDLLQHLSLPKYTDPGCDYIFTADVRRWVEAIRSARGTDDARDAA
jgi:hypothetical protein